MVDPDLAKAWLPHIVQEVNDMKIKEVPYYE